MRFWDSSALVPLLLGEETTGPSQAAHEEDPSVTVWWVTEVECASAIARAERDGRLNEGNDQVAFDRLRALAQAWVEVQPTSPVRQAAVRILRVHPLRAADALQLAAAVVAAGDDPRSLPFVTLDNRLAEAATREGFVVVVPAGRP